MVTTAIAAHVLSDSAVVLLLPLAGALFYVAGRHPLAGIVAAFAPLFGVMFANLAPSALDAILAGFSEGGARIIDSTYRVNPLSNYWLAMATAVAAVPVTWWLVDRVVEPRLASVTVDGDPALMPSAPTLTARERGRCGSRWWSRWRWAWRSCGRPGLSRRRFERPTARSPALARP